MFVGHYGISLAAKVVRPQTSLGGLFLAAQLADVAWGALVLIGIERVALIPGGVGPGGVEHDFVPFSHGMAGTLVLTAVVYLAVRLAPIGSGSTRAATAALVAAVAAAHYLLDVIVHPAELPIIDHSLEIGLGLAATWAFALETALLLAGLWLYLRATVARNPLGRYGMIGLVIGLIAFNFYVVTSVTPETLAIIVLSNLAAYAALAGIAEWLDRQRAPAATGRPA
ncbi:hypothetical protein [Agromyces laixinhei]|uniref:hypothetical protein n=1 Tax=Agromyces laixinhei TaxID=2585717 RepID=UPI001116CBD8|nr:hypothetical protein [Agromyces laixinhei]